MNKSILISIFCALSALTAAAQIYSGGYGTEADSVPRSVQRLR
jgi:hypothetical protein